MGSHGDRSGGSAISVPVISVNIYKAKQQSTTSIGAAAPHGCG